MSYTTEEGAQAIVELQAFAGIEESLDTARVGWDGLSEREREQTEQVHRMLKRKK